MQNPELFPHVPGKIPSPASHAGEVTLRKTGIDVLGDIPWGTHFCQFYQTREDLTDILVPYFSEGLRNNEFCMWITSEPLTEHPAREALRKGLPDLDRYLEKGQIEIIPYADWYTPGGGFDSEKVLNGWIDRLNRALAEGYEGLRLSGNTLWLEKDGWEDFRAYEEEVDDIITGCRMIALCTYPLDICGAREILDVVKHHHCAVAKREGSWELIESSRHKTVWSALQESELHYRSLFTAMAEGFALHEIICDERGEPIDYRFLDINPAFEKETGLKREDVVGRLKSAVLPGDDPDWLRIYGKVALTGEPVRFENYSSALGRHYEVHSYSPAPRRFATVFTDITRRKRIEQDLRESEESQRDTNELLTAIFNSTHALIACMDTEFNFITVNSMYALADNRAPGFFVGKNHFDLYPNTENEAIFRRVAETGEPYYIFAKPFEYAGRPERGSSYWNWSLIPVKDELGSIKMIVMSLLDVTAQIKAEQELWESRAELQKMNDELEERINERTKDLGQAAEMLEEQKEVLQSIIDNIPVMLAFYDSEGRIRLVNSEFERVLGWSIDEAQSMDLLASCCLQSSDREVWDGILEAKPVWKDFDIATRSGSIIHSSWANVRLSDSSLIGIGIDVSTRRKMEQDLLRLAAAIEQAGEGIVLFSPEGVIEYANPAYEILSGHKIGELIGKNTCSFAHEMNVDYKAIFDRVKTDGKTWIGRRTIKRCTGDVLEANMSVSPVLGATGDIINYVAVTQDITQEISLQRQLSQTQKMEAIGTLAGGIAHDLKNIFTPILINTEIALDDIGEDSPVRPLLREVLEATRLGVDLVRQIVTFSRRAPLIRKQVVVSSIIKEGLSFIRAALPATIEIRYQLKNTRSMILADPTQIKQVMINLGSNAAYAMRDKGGILEINLDNVDLDIGSATQVSPDLPPGPYVQIMVRDTGTGMDEKTAARVFEPFFTTKKGEGTGMGLAVVHGIVKDHQGAVTVRSKPGKGTTFTVYLPKLRMEKSDFMF